MRTTLGYCFVVLLLLAEGSACVEADATSLLDRRDVVPIAVWLQSPSNARLYKELGINLYVGLWDGPTSDQLTVLERSDMPVICDQNAEALKPAWKGEVVGFLQDDEPDNAQSLGKGRGYGPPIPPDQIIERYRKMKSADARPVMLNLGQGVAWDGYYGRGVRTNKPEDYPRYALGGDIVSFDIYPAVHDHPEIAGKLWYVGTGVRRLVKWTNGKKPVWACIECTHISNPKAKPTPAQVKAEVWMALIHGAKGIIYFSHQFSPRFIEAGLLADKEMCGAVRQLNDQVQRFAPELQSDAPAVVAEVTSDGPKEGVAVMTRRHGDETYVFAVGMSAQKVTGHFRLPEASGEAAVLDEDRHLPVAENGWTDRFDGYELHIYSVGHR